MKRILDIDTWNRKEHYHFFSGFDEPFSGLTTEVDVTRAQRFCKDKGIKFSLYYLHKSMLASNAVEAFRYRIEGEQVVIYDKIHGTMTVLRSDKTFGFTHFEFHVDFEAFAVAAEQSIQMTKQSSGLCFNEKNQRADSIHYTTSPWFGFSSLSHARDYKFKDSTPKIAFGKYKMVNGHLMMPVSIHVHHGLMDAYHISLFLDNFQQNLNQF